MNKLTKSIIVVLSSLIGIYIARTINKITLEHSIKEATTTPYQKRLENSPVVLLYEYEKGR